MRTHSDYRKLVYQQRIDRKEPELRLTHEEWVALGADMEPMFIPAERPIKVAPGAKGLLYGASVFVD
jgi:hypothetical protein